MSTTLRLLRSHHVRPRKQYGQSFLTEDHIFRKIVAAGDLSPEDTVVEIGSGLGVMTRMLANVAAKIIAVEIDPHLTDILRNDLKDTENVEIVQRDIRTCDLSEFAPRAPTEKIKVMGNIPYNITSEILFHLIKFRNSISDAVLLMQQEVAERLVAEPGTKAYGIPSVIFSMFSDLEILFPVSNRCFYPKPAVQSAVLRLVFLDTPRFSLKDEAFFRLLVRATFARRRKTLLNNLKVFREYGKNLDETRAILADLGIDGSRRAETLSSKEFANLANALALSDLRGPLS